MADESSAGQQRLDQALVSRGLAHSRSQAENLIKLGQVEVGGQVITKPGVAVGAEVSLRLNAAEIYVSRAALKLASVADKLGLDFRGKNVLDIGSSTGGFTDFALRHGARKVVAVDVGSGQLHPSLRGDQRIDLHEQTDIRDVTGLVFTPDIVLADVSFVSLKEILPTAARLSEPATQIVAMVKPQFEAGSAQKHKGVIKNAKLRRSILKDFEQWAQQGFIIKAKADSAVAGAKGNLERFYLLHKL